MDPEKFSTALKISSLSMDDAFFVHKFSVFLTAAEFSVLFAASPHSLFHCHILCSLYPTHHFIRQPAGDRQQKCSPHVAGRSEEHGQKHYCLVRWFQKLYQ